MYSSVVAIKFIAMGAWFNLSLASASVCLGSKLCFRVAREPEMQEWVSHKKRKEKLSFRLNQEMLDAIDRFYFNHYCRSFRSGAFARANSSMYVLLDLYFVDLISRVIFKPHGEHARSVDALLSIPVLSDDIPPPP